MATDQIQPKSQIEPTVGLRFAARQPILDLRSQVFGYELLFRSGADSEFSGDREIATRTMLDNAVMFGLEKLTAGLPAFVNCTAQSLTDGMVNVLPASMTVLEIEAPDEPSPELIAACRRLKTLGFRIALDNFSWDSNVASLVELASYLKVDFLNTAPALRQELIKRLRNKPITLVAKKVETQEDLKSACDEGFTLFQGFYFCRPLLMKNRKVPANKFVHIQILSALQRDPLDVRVLGDLLKQSTSLTYRILRAVNSPILAMRHEIKSIQAALLAAGDDAVRRIGTLAITSELGSSLPPEVLRLAFVRGRFCELAAKTCMLAPREQYLIGMFSLLPAMLQTSMSELAPTLPLREKTREALLGAVSIESSLLSWSQSRERGDWNGCDSIARSFGLDPDELIRLYADAMVWAEMAMPAVVEEHSVRRPAVLHALRS